jgi:hypothetical protein
MAMVDTLPHHHPVPERPYWTAGDHLAAIARKHSRRRAETKKHCAKRPGQRRTARDFDREVAGIRERAVLLDGLTEPRTPFTECTDQIVPGKQDARPSPDLWSRTVHSGLSAQ